MRIPLLWLNILGLAGLAGTTRAQIDAAGTPPDTYFRKIAEELRTSYEVAYYPTNKAQDDSFRKIAIRSKLEGVKIKAKTGHFKNEYKQNHE